MAQKETVNTFTGGMVMDIHPLTTPNNVLTNCLNGTLVTFNGNEMILQNDMGNAIVKSDKNGDLVKLPEGFVPVGTAELGGIIYISSFNPETKECQLGSFPSPERNIEPDITKNPIGFNPENLLNKGTEQNPVKVIYFDQNDKVTDSETENMIYPLIKGGIKIDLTTEELHSGDYYTINVTDGTIPVDAQYEFKLISVSEDGTIMDLNFVGFGQKQYYTAPNAGKLALLVSPKKLNSFSCTYTNLKQNGTYTQSEDVCDYIEVDSVPTEYKGEHVVVYDWDYYQLEEIENLEATELQGNYYQFTKLVNPDLSLIYDIIDINLYNSNSFIRYNNIDYLFDSTNNIFKSGSDNSGSIDEKTKIKLQNPQFKVKKQGSQYAHKYKWISGGWDSTLVCKWNDQDKEENKSVQLSGIVIDTLYSVTSSDRNSKEITVLNQTPINNIIELKVYPVINLDNSNRGYIEELVQTVILDTTLKAGQVKLTMWKYYYENNVINLQYGFTGLLDQKKEINKITISALEYKKYTQGAIDHNEITLIELKDRDSYFGSYYDQIEVGKQLLPNKLYAITIKIDTNYSDPIYIYRWLYTNDVFNNKFNTPILDYNEEKIVLSNLKCNIKIDGDNDQAIKVSNLDAQYKSIEASTEDVINGGDYTSYGYTKNIIDDQIPYEFTYDSGNELFNLQENSNLQSEIIDIKTNGITTPYDYVDNEDLVLNSYPGQEEESGISTSIWSSAYRYQHYTDYVGIKSWNHNSIQFKGRIYNKIKGKIATINISGKQIYTPLVYDINSARKFNLEYKNGDISPIYYLCIECYPPVSVRKHPTWFTSESHDWIQGRLSEFKIKLDISEDYSIVKLKRENSFEDINTNLSCGISTSSSSDGTSINLNNENCWNQGKALHKKVIDSLSDFGITNCKIIPIALTKLNGTLKNVQYSRGGSDDWYDSNSATLQDIKLIVGSSNKGGLSASRDGDNKTQMEIDNYHCDVTLGLLDQTDNLYISDDTVSINGSNNCNLISRKIFNLLSQVYISTGRSSDYTVYCLTDYDYQQDYQAKVNISGKIRTKITSHQIVTGCSDNYISSEIDSFEKWNPNNLMIEESDGILTNFNCYKLFEIQQLLVQQYENQTSSKIKSKLEGNTDGSVISCFKDQAIAAPDDGSANCYIVNNSHKLIPIESPFKIYFDIGNNNIIQNPDGTFVTTYSSIENGKNVNFLSFDSDLNQLKYNHNDAGNNIKIDHNISSVLIGDDRSLQGHSVTITNTTNKGL